MQISYLQAIRTGKHVTGLPDSLRDLARGHWFLYAVPGLGSTLELVWVQHEPPRCEPFAVLTFDGYSQNDPETGRPCSATVQTNSCEHDYVEGQCTKCLAPEPGH